MQCKHGQPARACSICERQWEYRAAPGGVDVKVSLPLLIVVPVEPQPKHGPMFQIQGDASGDWYITNRDAEIPLFGGTWKPPYRPGDVLEVAVVSHVHREHLIVKRVEARRVQGLTGGEIEATGIDVAAKLPAMLPPNANLDKLCGRIASDLMEKHWNRTYTHLGPQFAWDRDPYGWVITAADAAKERE